MGETIQMTYWEIERIVNFGPGDLCKNGFVHFGFHDREGNQYVIEHQKHFLGLVGENDKLKWTVAASTVFHGVPNIAAELRFPMYIDRMLDGALVASNFGNNHLYRIDVERMKATLLLDGSTLGMKDVGNCVVDDEGCIWVNEVEGCRLWRLESTGKPMLTLGDGKPGFQPDVVRFDRARFNWIYDIRKGPDRNIYVLDSKNFAVRMVDVKNRTVTTLAGTGKGGYEGDGGSARSASFGSSPEQHFDGPISLSLDEEGNIFVGDRYNHVVRMIQRKTWMIETIAGKHKSTEGKGNDRKETDPLKINLPAISSMDYYKGRLFIPTDITGDLRDLILMKKRL